MPPRPDAVELAELPALHEGANRLRVGTVAMIHPDHHDLAATVGRPHDFLGALAGEGHRLLDHHVQSGREPGLDMGLVEVVRRADQERIEALVSDQVLDVVVDAGDPEAAGERPRLGNVGVAEGRDLDRPEFLENRQVRDLEHRACPHHTQPYGV